MRDGLNVAVVIPAMNEEDAIGKVIEELPDWVDQIVVADNGSTDRTAAVAKAKGADVVHQPEGAYGAACLAGIAHADSADIIAFVDGDYSDYPADLGKTVDPIARGEADLVIGSRVLGKVEPQALTPQQRFGNALACWLIHLFWRHRYTDLGPFRAIRRTSLDQLRMQDEAFGWTVEMQIKALQHKLRVQEVPIDYRRRIGKSKISGTLRGTILAGHAILGTIFRTALFKRGGA